MGRGYRFGLEVERLGRFVIWVFVRIFSSRILWIKFIFINTD